MSEERKIVYSIRIGRLHPEYEKTPPYDKVIGMKWSGSLGNTTFELDTVEKALEILKIADEKAWVIYKCEEGGYKEEEVLASPHVQEVRAEEEKEEKAKKKRALAKAKRIEALPKTRTKKVPITGSKVTVILRRGDAETRWYGSADAHVSLEIKVGKYKLNNFWFDRYITKDKRIQLKKFKDYEGWHFEKDSVMKTDENIKTFLNFVRDFKEEFQKEIANA
jgi:hypothetical protein